MSASISTAVLLLLLAATFSNYGFCTHNRVVCHEREKKALVKFKHGLIDPSNRLSSWSDIDDCCRWSGVRCDNVTGRVTQLRLRNPYELKTFGEVSEFSLSGNIDPALLELEFLSYLDLSMNNFAGTHIPSFIGSMRNLRYLNLSFTEFEGLVNLSHQLGNLSALRYLDLSLNGLEGLIPHQLGNLSALRYLDLSHNAGLAVDKFNWVGSLYSLEYLDMSDVDLGKADDHWLQVLNLLPSLSELHLVGCNLNSIPPLGYVNFTSLQLIDLSNNHINSKIPDWLLNLTTSLVSLNLEYNSLYGNIPDGFGQLKHLQHLTVLSNSLDGPIPASLLNLSSLRTFDLSYNRLNDTLPKSIWLLPNLEKLDLSVNSLAGIVSEVNFAKLTKLKFLDMSHNSMFNFSVNPNWIPPFQLEFLDLSRCKLGPKFPDWLRTQTFLKWLDISHSGISDTAPHWFWKLALNIEYLSLFDNQIYGDVSNIMLNSTFIRMNSNRFHGRLPSLSPNVEILSIANNSLSGLVSSFLCQKMHRKNKLQFMDLSNNLLSGGLSRCWMYWRNLSTLNLGNNNLFGKIPNSMGSLFRLHKLQLHNNNFLGNIPSSLLNCTELQLLNLGGNEFTGLIQNWIGEMASLMHLELRSNKFVGNIPPNICQLSGLAVLDLANNSLSGTIPTCLKNLSTMATIHHSGLPILPEDNYASDNLGLVTKGRESEYGNNLQLVRSIDLSSNNLSGSIPDEIASLVEIQSFNLSHNHLTGKVPEKIGVLTKLESLDLSRNYLSGEIPQSMSNLTFLDYLDLSYNNFSGRIPSSTQLQSFDEASFIGNAELCGPPLPKNCTKEDVSQASTIVGKDGEMSEMSWFCIGLGPGFAAGFWGVCGVIFFKRNWRHAYFQFLIDMKDRIYVATVLFMNRFRKWFKRSNNV